MNPRSAPVSRSRSIRRFTDGAERPTRPADVARRCAARPRSAAQESCRSTASISLDCCTNAPQNGIDFRRLPLLPFDRCRSSRRSPASSSTRPTRRRGRSGPRSPARSSPPTRGFLARRRRRGARRPRLHRRRPHRRPARRRRPSPSADVLVIAHPSDPKWEHTVGDGDPAPRRRPRSTRSTRFVERGGGLIVLGETEQEKYGNNLNELLARFGLGVENATVQDYEHHREAPSWVLADLALRRRRPGPDLLARVGAACFYRAGTLAARQRRPRDRPHPRRAPTRPPRPSPRSPSTAPAASPCSPTPTSSATTASATSTTPTSGSTSSTGPPARPSPHPRPPVARRRRRGRPLARAQGRPSPSSASSRSRTARSTSARHDRDRAAELARTIAGRGRRLSPRASPTRPTTSRRCAPTSTPGSRAASPSRTSSARPTPSAPSGTAPTGSSTSSSSRCTSRTPPATPASRRCSSAPPGRTSSPSSSRPATTTPSSSRSS